MIILLILRTFFDVMIHWYCEEKVDVGRSWDLQVLRADGENQNY